MPKGHEIAFEQFVLQSPKKKAKYYLSNDPCTVEEESNTFVLKSKNSKILLDQHTGQITMWDYMGQVITTNGFTPNFWRPPTDNDLGNDMQNWAKSWQDLTLNSSPKLESPPSLSNGNITYQVTYDLGENIAQFIIDYTFTSTDELILDVQFKPLKDSLPNIPRMGMSLLLSNNFTNTKWYGRGPHETYWDRKTSGKIGIYEGAIEDQFHRYSRPQETGNKTDLRWMSVSSDLLEVTVNSEDEHLLNGSVWPFTTSELDFVAGKDGGKSASGLVPVTSKHGAHIQVGDQVQWNIDHLQMGVGGDNSWGRLVHDEYTIPVKEYRYSFKLTPSSL